MAQASAHDLATTRLCKTPGCTNEANTKYDRGFFAGLCEQVCIPAARRRASERSTAVHREQADARVNGTSSLLGELGALTTLARRADTLRARAAVQARKALDAKREADKAALEYREALRSSSTIEP